MQCDLIDPRGRPRTITTSSDNYFHTCPSKISQNNTTSSENSDRYGWECGSGRGDRWWRLSCITLFATKLLLLNYKSNQLSWLQPASFVPESKIGSSAEWLSRACRPPQSQICCLDDQPSSCIEQVFSVRNKLSKFSDPPDPDLIVLKHFDPVMITIFTHVLSSVLTFKIAQKQDIQVRIVITTDGIVGLAERIMDDTLFCFWSDLSVVKRFCLCF